MRRFQSGIWTEHEYLKIVAANMVNRFGDSVDAVAFGWLVYALTGSGEWLAVILGVNYLPAVLLQPFTGAWVNYLDKKWVMVLCDLGRGLLVLLIALGYLGGWLMPWMLLVITLLNSSLEALRQPCGLSVLPGVLRPEHLESAMAFNQSACRACELVGMGLSGVIVAVLGVGGAVLVDAATFLLSGAILTALRLPAEQEQPDGGYFGQLRSGLGYYRGNRVLVLVTCFCCLLNLVSVPLESLRAAFIAEGLRLAEDALTAGSVGLSVGLFLGAAGYGVLSRIPKRRLLSACGLGVGLIYLSLWAVTGLPQPWLRSGLYAVLCLLYGAATSAVGVALNVVMMRNVDRAFLGRVGGVFNALVCASMPAAALFFAALQRVLPISGVYLFTAAVAAAGFLLLAARREMAALK